MQQDEYKNKFSEDDAVGWESIDQHLQKYYPNQEPQHFGTLIKYSMGGDEPLDGISIYECDRQQGHYHLASYGLSELYYNEEACGNEFSKFGFELSFRVPKQDAGDLYWAMGLMQFYARYVFQSGKWFDPYHFAPANNSINNDPACALTGVAFVLDPELGKIDTPHGEVQFLQMFGLTTAELEKLFENPTTSECQKFLEPVQQLNPLLITDFSRS